MALQLRPKLRILPNRSLTHFFSTSQETSASPPEVSSSGSHQPLSPSQSQSRGPSASPDSSDIKAKLKQQQQQQHSQQLRWPTAPFSSPGQSSPSKITTLEEIRKNLSEFLRRSAVPVPGDSPLAQPVSVKELLKRNVIPKGDDNQNDFGPPRPVSQRSFDAIRESMKQPRNKAGPPADRRPVNGGDPLALSRLKDSLKLKPVDDGTSFLGGTDKLPQSVFGKEIRERETAEERRKQGDGATKTEFLRMYSYDELGSKLRDLRSESLRQGKGEFSLEELNERLGKLREMEDREAESRIGGIGGIGFRDLRDGLLKLRMSEEDKNKKSSYKRLFILDHWTQTPDFMMQPPKEHLVEQYLHPDNMSAEEKMKLELARVREEFKLSESDCGSARVQVAQLTTKIKYLSSVLHKKDKHSRKGLQEMVQRRKKLLKYLRRTDWDSYSLVLSRFGLRDNPDFKH